MITENQFQVIQGVARESFMGGAYYNSSTQSGYAPASPSTTASFTYVWRGIPTGGDFCNFGDPLGGQCAFYVTAGVLYLLRDNVLEPSAIPPTGPATPGQYAITVDTVAQLITWYVNGAQAGQYAWVGAGSYAPRVEGWIYSFTGRVLDRHIINRVLTSTELGQMLTGDVPQPAAFHAVSGFPATFVNGRFGLNAWNTFSTGTNSVTFSGTNGTSSCVANLPFQAAAGQPQRVVFTVTGYAATTSPLGVGIWDRSTTVYATGSVIITGNGSYTLLVTSPVASIQNQLVIECDTPGGGGATVTITECSNIGVVTKHPLNGVTPSGFWNDLSGNGNFVAPQPGMTIAGGTPQLLKFPVTRGSATPPDLFNASAYASFTATGAYPSAALAVAAPGDTVTFNTASALPAGIIVGDSPEITGVGVISQALYSSGESLGASGSQSGVMTLIKS